MPDFGSTGSTSGGREGRGEWKLAIEKHALRGILHGSIDPGTCFCRPIDGNDWLQFAGLEK